MTHFFLVPGGGRCQDRKSEAELQRKAQAKVGSLDNVGHLPAGGAVKVVLGSGRAGEGWAVHLESGPSPWAPVTAPQSLQESCFTHFITVPIVSHPS